MSDKYENLDGIRVYACIGIILMHVLANSNYNFSGFVFDKLIPSFTDFTYLFMILSGFSLCCGYYENFINKNIDIEKFYNRRYQKIWPTFSILCTLELFVNHDLNSLYEWFADLTLAFGLIPNHNIEVVGVGWFLGGCVCFLYAVSFLCISDAKQKKSMVFFF